MMTQTFTDWVAMSVNVANTSRLVRLLARGGTINWWLTTILSGLVAGGFAGWVTALLIAAIRGY